MSNNIRIIKKYPNRRLYDTEISRYITLSGVRELVMKNESFEIHDAKTGEDITRNVLLQIILEQEELGKPIFSNQALKYLIRFYGATSQDNIVNYLENSFRLFSEYQRYLNDRFLNPLTYVSDFTDRQRRLWQEVQDSFTRVMSESRQKQEGDDNAPGIPPDNNRNTPDKD